MTRIKRPAAAVGATVLLAFSLSACGGAPTDASEKDFCEAYNSSADADVDPEDAEAQAEALNDFAAELEEVGTPEDIPEDARKGFEVVVEAFGEISAGDLEDEDAQQSLEEKYAEDEDDVNAFFEYAAETCAPEIESPDGTETE